MSRGGLTVRPVVYPGYRLKTLSLRVTARHPNRPVVPLTYRLSLGTLTLTACLYLRYMTRRRRRRPEYLWQRVLLPMRTMLSLFREVTTRIPWQVAVALTCALCLCRTLATLRVAVNWDSLVRIRATRSWGCAMC